MNAKDRPALLLAWHGFLAQRVDEDRERHPVGAHRRLDHIRQVTLVLHLVHVLEPLRAELLVLPQVEVGAIVHSLDFLEPQ